MNLIKLTLFSFLLLISSVYTVLGTSSGTDFDFDIQIENTYYDNEEVDCNIDYDNNHDDITLDQNDERFSYGKSFEDDMRIACTKILDKLTLTVTDSEDVIMFQKIYLNVNDIRYIIDTADKTKQYFSIDLTDHNFALTGRISCTLNIDDKYTYDYDFESATKYEDLTISRNFDKNVVFDCDEQFDTINFDVYKTDRDLLHSQEYTNEDNFKYDISGTQQNHFDLDITHDFSVGENFECDLKIDDDRRETFTYDTDTDPDDFRLKKDFTSDISFDCDADVDVIDLTVYDSKFKLIEQVAYETENSFDYEFNQGSYGFLLQIENDFEYDEEISCDLKTDDDDKITYDLDASSSLSELRIEDAFEEDFEYDCDDNIDSFHILIFDERIDKNADILLFEKTYTNVDRITLTSKDIQNNLIPVEDMSKNLEEDKNKDSDINIEEDKNNIIEEKSKTETQMNDNNLNSIENEIKQKELNSSSNQINNTINENEKPQVKSTDITWLVVSAGLGVLVVFGIGIFVLLL